jgi:hypothetical protein
VGNKDTGGPSKEVTSGKVPGGSLQLDPWNAQECDSEVKSSSGVWVGTSIANHTTCSLITHPVLILCYSVSLELQAPPLQVWRKHRIGPPLVPNILLYFTSACVSLSNLHLFLCVQGELIPGAPEDTQI